jgi:hypothetical protein
VTDDQNLEIAKLLGQHFIQRREPIAQQTASGGYRPMRDQNKVPTATFGKATLLQHLSGTATYGHYMLDHDDMTKLFVLDVDLTKMGFVPTKYLPAEATDSDYEAWVRSFVFVDDLRAVWHSRKRKDAPARAYIKYQLRLVGNTLASATYSLLDIRTAVAYTGNKGIHIYGFTGKLKADFVRDAAELVLDSVTYLKPSRGDNFYADVRREVIATEPTDAQKPTAEYVARWESEGPPAGFDPGYFHNFHIELFPKQRSLEGKDLGNLVRLPLGKNLHNPTDPTFFVDLTKPLTELSPVDSVYALTTENPWQTQAEHDAAGK